MSKCSIFEFKAIAEKQQYTENDENIKLNVSIPNRYEVVQNVWLELSNLQDNKKQKQVKS